MQIAYPAPNNQALPLAIYIHWPFCRKKCPYCDFNSHVRASINHDSWLAAYRDNIQQYRELIANSRITSIFFGGGTPSLASAAIVATIIEEIAKITHISPKVEITLEANPTSVEAAKFAEFKLAGVNRISLGIQAINSDNLAFLGREHSVDEALQAVQITERLFDNYSLDFIYALPTQNLADWEHELKRIIQLSGPHLSLYQLTIEQGTKFAQMYEKGLLTPMNPDKAALFYAKTQEIMEQHAMPAYEISNHARPGYESQHNLSYWRYQDYLGLGPGAHSRLSWARLAGLKDEELVAKMARELTTKEQSPVTAASTLISNYATPADAAKTLITGNNYNKATQSKIAFIASKIPETWLKQIQETSLGIAEHEFISQRQAFTEKLLMGLRLREGVMVDAGEVEFMNYGNLAGLVARGLLEVQSAGIDGNLGVNKRVIVAAGKLAQELSSSTSGAKFVLRITGAGTLISDAIINEIINI